MRDEYITHAPKYLPKEIWKVKRLGFFKNIILDAPKLITFSFREGGGSYAYF